MLRKLFTILFLSAILFSACGKEDSPEIALNNLKIALAERNSENFAAHVDLNDFFSKTYDAVTIELAKNYETYKEKYPDDPYFQHSADFISNYNAQHKNLHLKFLNGVAKAYFAKIPEPIAPEDNPTAFVANEFEKFRHATNSTIKKIVVNQNSATIILELAGDSSPRGKFIGNLTFNLVFRKDNQNQRWLLDKIENLDELTPILVDKAEIIWINF